MASQKGKKSAAKKPMKKAAIRSVKKSSKKKSVKTMKKPAKKPVRKKVKKSRKKGVLITLLVLTVLIATGIVYLLFNLNFIVKSAIEKYGSQATQTAVRVQKVHISLKEGSASIEELTVANPKGFETPLAFSLGQIVVDIDLKSLTGDEIGIDNIVVQAPEIFVEINEDKKNNLNELKKNLLSASSQPAKSTTSGEKNTETILFIRHLLFSNGQIDAKVIPMNKEYQLKMPSVEMWNLRGTPRQITFQVINRLTSKALAEVKKKGVGQATEKIGDKAKSLLKTKKLRL
jgi:hypothetical protein